MPEFVKGNALGFRPVRQASKMQEQMITTELLVIGIGENPLRGSPPFRIFRDEPIFRPHVKI
jgi:hypothetical protein